MPDFPPAEFAARLARAQAGMAAAGFDALFLTTEAELRYFTGFRTAFWQSPTRGWFLVVPATGRPIAVIPTIGAELMATTWIDDIRCFEAPARGAPHLGLLHEALAGARRIGMPMGDEATLRMPLAAFETLRAGLAATWHDATPLVRGLRMVKSAAEIAHLRRICAIGSAAFARAADVFLPGQTLASVFREFRIALLLEGAEEVPYLVGGAGPGGYGDVISPPSDRALQAGDVLMLDTGATRAGYFCDFDRNWSVGPPARDTVAAQHRLWDATERALAAVRPGITAAELFHLLAAPLGAGSGIGRMGHGLGMQLTEWPSLCATDHTVLEPGMVLTLEPSVQIAPGRMLVHEENLVVTETGAELLSTRAPRDLPVLG